MELIFVHLTDIHVKDENDFDVLLERISSLSGVICNHITEPDDSIVFLCSTGDFAYSGLEEQYDAVSMILQEMCSIIEKRFSKVRICSVFVPGNHDCNFMDEGNIVREVILASPELDIENSDQLNLCTNIQQNYFNFVSKYGAMSCKTDKILTENIVNLTDKGVVIKFHCINTSWCSKKIEEKGKMKIVNGKMVMPSNQFTEKRPEDIVITMMHHDAEWLDWADKEVWNDYHKKNSDIIFVGHDHTVEYTLKENYDESTNYFIKGNQLFDKNRSEQSGFNILKLCFTSKDIQECFFTYEWNGNIYKKVIETGYRVFKQNRFFNSGIELKKEVKDFLEDMGIDISCGKRKELKLSDVFGFPTLKEEKDNVTNFFRDMNSLLTYIEKVKYISVKGQKEYGKTSLLKQIFIEFHRMKKYPVYLDVSRINTADGETLNQIVSNAYKGIYRNIDNEEIMQKGAEERVCFIDNFEEIKLSDVSSKKFLQYLINKFGYVVIARNHTLDILNPLNYVEMNNFIQEKFNTLIIQPTRKTSKERIINRWLQLGSEDDENCINFDARRKEKYMQINNVMRSNYFNKTPLDLLMVLSYLEEDQPVQLDYSRYSYVYDNLILSKLTAIAENESGRTSNNISVYKTILQKLAYKMYLDDIADSVDESYVLGVILDYKEHHSNTKLKIADVLTRLVDYRFLDNKNNSYKFKYSYMYYYFVGSYIESVLSPTERELIIRKVFENINEDINYNVALFLAYRLNIEYQIIPLVKEFGANLLEQYKTFSYDNIRTLLEDWGGEVDKKVNRIYNVPQNEEIPEIREKTLETLEEREIQNEINDKNEEIDEELQKANGDVLKLSRYIDFMGNILKNYSGKMENKPREEGIDFVFQSVSKIIGSLCNFSMYMVDKIIRMVEEKIKEGEEEDIQFKSQFSEAIKAIFARNLFTFMENNLMCIASCLDSDILSENIAGYCERHKSEFVKMANVEYLIRISSTRLPVNEINALFKGKNCLSEISQIILKDNIYRYLSSYQYDASDRQAVCSILKFNNKDLLIQEKKLLALDKY